MVVASVIRVQRLAPAPATQQTSASIASSFGAVINRRRRRRRRGQVFAPGVVLKPVAFQSMPPPVRPPAGISMVTGISTGIITVLGRQLVGR